MEIESRHLHRDLIEKFYNLRDKLKPLGVDSRSCFIQSRTKKICCHQSPFEDELTYYASSYEILIFTFNNPVIEVYRYLTVNNKSIRVATVTKKEDINLLVRKYLNRNEDFSFIYNFRGIDTPLYYI